MCVKGFITEVLVLCPKLNAGMPHNMLHTVTFKWSAIIIYNIKRRKDLIL